MIHTWILYVGFSTIDTSILLKVCCHIHHIVSVSFWFNIYFCGLLLALFFWGTITSVVYLIRLLLLECEQFITMSCYMCMILLVLWWLYYYCCCFYTKALLNPQIRFVIQSLQNCIREIKLFGKCCYKKTSHLRVVTVTLLCIEQYPTILPLLTMLGLYTFQPPHQSRSNINITYCYRPLVLFVYFCSHFCFSKRLLTAPLPCILCEWVWKKLHHGFGIHYSAHGRSSSPFLLWVSSLKKLDRQNVLTNSKCDVLPGISVELSVCPDVYCCYPTNLFVLIH